jgi:hypothetical protein
MNVISRSGVSSVNSTAGIALGSVAPRASSPPSLHEAMTTLAAQSAADWSRKARRVGMKD